MSDAVPPRADTAPAADAAPAAPVSSAGSAATDTRSDEAGPASGPTVGRSGSRFPFRRRRAEDTTSDRPVWWLTFAAFSLLLGVWALATPLSASPDENTHVIKAAAVARGQLVGPDAVDVHGDAVTKVRVPASVVSDTPCWAHKPTVTANCLKRTSRSTALVGAETRAGHYPPLYYAIVGVASDLVPSHRGVYLMRLFSAVLCSAFLSSAFVSVRRWSTNLGGVGFLAATTPMVVFLGSTVNPSGLEIAAAIGVWAAALTLLADPGGVPTRVIVRLGVAAGFLTLTRSLSPLWLALAVLLCCLAAGWTAVRTVLARRDLQICAVFVGLATVAAVAWIKFVGALDLRPNRGLVPEPFTVAFDGTLIRLPYRLEQMIGFFGWLDTPAPLWTLVVWIAALGLLVLLVLSSAGRLSGLAVVLTMVLTVVVPGVIEASQEKTLGFVWQGRYTLPLTVGLPLLAARYISLDPATTRVFVRRLATIAVVALLSGQLTAFVWNLRRYTVGKRDSFGLTGTLAWKPPLLPAWLYTVLVVVALVVLGVLARGTARRLLGDQRERVSVPVAATG